MTTEARCTLCTHYRGGFGGCKKAGKVSGGDYQRTCATFEVKLPRVWFVVPHHGYTRRSPYLGGKITPDLALIARHPVDFHPGLQYSLGEPAMGAEWPMVLHSAG